MQRLVDRLTAHPLAVALTALAVTLLLAVPLLALAPEGTASQEPDGPAFDARDLVDERLDPAISETFVILEAPGGDLLAPEVLRELLVRGDRLRSDPELGPLLVTVPQPGTGTAVDGVQTIADVVDAALVEVGGLAGASDDVVQVTTTAVIEEVGATNLGLSTHAARAPDGRWTAPAQATPVLLDNAALGGGGGGAQLGADDTLREDTLREVRDVLRGGAAGDEVTRAQAGPVVAHAVAADVNLTAAEQGEAAGPFIGITVLLTLLLVGLVFRSTWTVAVGGAGIAALMIWLGGIANLVGLKEDQILSTVVPIALVSFGVDFAFHALGRVREEASPGRAPRRALAAGLAGVMGALVLALASDTAAFLSNVTSGIESIVQLGVAAAIGLVSAFVLLGIVLPTLVTWVEERVPAPRPGAFPTALRVAGAVAAASMAMTTVLLTVFIAPAAGVVAFVVQVLATIVVPTWLASRRDAAVVAARAPRADLHEGRLGHWVGSLVVGTARRRWVVLPVVALVTGVAIVGALRVETRFDVEDFFSGDTDFVVALDALDEHVGDSGGEPVAIVVTADLGDPEVVARLGVEVDALGAGAAGTGFAVDDAGEVLVDGGVVDLLRHATTDPVAAAQVTTATAVAPTDADGDGLPDTRAGIDAALSVAADEGLAGSAGGPAWAASQVVEVVDRGAADDMTTISLQLPGSREVAAIESARDQLEPRTSQLAADLASIDPEATATLTGAPVVRQIALDAVSRALLVSLPIALLACLLVAGSLLRSLRYAVVAIVPIMLVVPWLYGAMHAMGFAINLVTGTIGAVSIGIGIDFAVHLVARFREELGHHEDPVAAMRATGEGTGVALVASAMSSVVGFLVLSFAPMPLFASYGLLTAMMIAMALAATLLVLPSLLLLVTPSRRPEVAVPEKPERPERIVARA